MKKQIIGGFFALVALFFTVVGCHKDAQTVNNEPTLTTSKVDAVKGDFRVENGILHFDNSKALRDVLEQLLKIDISERRHFGEAQGFYSYLNAYGQLMDKCSAAAEDDAEYDRILRENVDIIDINANGTFKMRLLTKSLAAILNREGIVYVGKAACRFTDWGEAITNDGDIERLKVVNSTTPSSGNITVFSQSTLSTRGPCGQVMNQPGVPSTTKSGYWGDFYCAVQGYILPLFDINGFPVINASGQPLFDFVSSTYSIGTPWTRNWRGRTVTFRSNNRLSLNQSLSSTGNYPGAFLNSCIFGENISYTNCWTAIDYNGSGCVLFGAPKIASGPVLYATYITANNKYEMTSDGVEINLTCQ